MTAKKVLVIDDSIMIRKMVKSILAGTFEVLEANDGKTGLEAAKRYNPDLILLDFVMPKYNGYQTLQAIRRFESLRDIPVIMISGLKEQVAEHVPEPFVGFEFLEKPFEAEVLVARIQRLLNGSGAGVPQTAASASRIKEEDQAVQHSAVKPTAAETLLIQGMENLIQREVVAKVSALATRVQKQEATISSIEQRLDKISSQLEHQNKGIMVLLREIRALQATISSK